MNKKNLFAIALVFVFFLFQQPLMAWYDEEVVAKIWSKAAHGNGVFLLQFLFIELLAWVGVYLVTKKVKVPAAVTYIAALLCFMYLKARYFCPGYTFYASAYAPGFKYADCLLIALTGILLLALIGQLTGSGKPVYKQKPFLVDVPISFPYHDQFNRHKFARHLADKIQSELLTQNSGALAVGINGPWGAGKTSFLNLIKAEIDPHNRIIIHFNPWRSASPAKIIEDYFQLLVHELAKFDTGLSDELSKYAKTLTEIDENAITKGVKSVSEFLFGEEAKEIYYVKINESINKIHKQIIVFIDDLDRLDKKEVVEVLRIIRNTANFNQIVYLAAYDKNYVLEAVKDFNPHNHEFFLEKIFQFEFNLPAYDTSALRQNLKDLLRAGLADPAQDEVIGGAVDFFSASGHNLTSRVVVTQRDVFRLANSFLFEVELVKQEVNLVDFYLIQLLKLRYYKLYSVLSANRNAFFIRDGNQIRLRKRDESSFEVTDLDRVVQRLHHDRGQGQAEQAETTVLADYLEKTMAGETERIDRQVIGELIEGLFVDKKLRNSLASTDHRSFALGVNFEKYFTIQQLESDFSGDELEKVRLGGYVDYLARVRTWLAGEHERSELKTRLERLIDFDSRQEWENHLRILLEIGRGELSPYNVFSVNYRQILEVIAYPMERNGTNRFFESPEAYHDFIAGIFAQAEEPYVLECNLLNAALVGVVDFPLSDAEIEAQLLTYLQTYAQAHGVVDTTVIQLYNGTVHKTQVVNRAYPVQQAAYDFFTGFYRGHFSACQLGGFITLHDPQGPDYMLNHEAIRRYFDDLPALLEYINGAAHIDRQSLCYTEFMGFVNKVAASEHPAVEYPFQHLPLSILV